MSRTGLVFVMVMLAACSTDKPRSELTSPYVLAAKVSEAPTDEGCLLDVSDCPPQAWIDSPAELAPAFPQKNSDCDFTMFGLAPTIPQWDLHPTAACQQRQWGNSGVYRQQARDIHVTSLPKRCGGPGDIDEIRLCSLAWVNKPTPFGAAGAAGCVVVKLEVTCGV